MLKFPGSKEQAPDLGSLNYDETKPNPELFSWQHEWLFTGVRADYLAEVLNKGLDPRRDWMGSSFRPDSNVAYLVEGLQ